MKSIFYRIALCLTVIYFISGCASQDNQFQNSQLQQNNQFQLRLSEYKSYNSIEISCLGRIKQRYLLATTFNEREYLNIERYNCVNELLNSNYTIVASPLYVSYLALANENEQIDYQYAYGKIDLEQANKLVLAARIKNLGNTFDFGTSQADGTGAPSGGGCAENGSCYGDISSINGMPKTTHVDGYYRSNGTYVRGHYRSSGRR
jgi:hypothetical protein